MAKNLNWLSNDEWASIHPHFPTGRRGARRVDDRRVISGILHMMKTGARRRDCPPDYGPYTTIYNRFNRRSKQGVWEDIFYVLSGSSGVVGTASADSTSIKAHRSASGGKGWSARRRSDDLAAEKLHLDDTPRWSPGITTLMAQKLHHVLGH